jgi:ribosomal protein L19
MDFPKCNEHGAISTVVWSNRIHKIEIIYIGKIKTLKLYYQDY